MTPADIATWILTYAVHSTVLLGGAWLLTRHPRLAGPATADALWKAALVGGVVTATVHQIGMPGQLGWAVEWSAAAAGAPEAAGPMDAGPEYTGPVAADPIAGGELAGPQVAIETAPPAVAPSPDVEIGKVFIGGGTTIAVDSATVTITGPAPAPIAPAPAISSSIAAAPTISAPAAEPAGLATPAGPSLVARIAMIALAAWAGFAVLAILRLAVAHVRLARWLAPRMPVNDPAMLATADDLARSAGLSGVRLTWSPDLYSPVALGRREVCLPSAVFDELDEGQIRSVLAHEIAHLARRDPLWLAFSVVLERVFFFQPLNRLARERMMDAAEFLCDEWAARESGSGITLATSLARVAEWLEPAPPRPLPLAGIGESRSQLLRRVHRLMEADVAAPATGAWKARAAAAALVIATALAVPGIGVAERPSADDLNYTDAPVDKVQDSGTIGYTDADQFPEVQASDTHRVVASKLEIGLENLKLKLDELKIDQSDLNIDLDKLSDAQVKLAEKRLAASGVSDTTRARIVQALIEGLRDSDAEVRAASAEALGDLEDRRAVPALIAALGDDQTAVRHAAVHALAHLEDTAAVMPLVGMLRDPDAETRMEAANTLGNLEDTRAMQPLIPLLRDPSVEVRRAAAEALGNLEDPRAADALAAALSDEDAHVRHCAAEALGQLELTTAPDELLAAMRDADRDVQLSAVESVGDMGDARAVPVLRELLNASDPELQKCAVEALGNIGGPEALEALVGAMRSTNPTVRKYAAEALGDD